MAVEDATVNGAARGRRGAAAPELRVAVVRERLRAVAIAAAIGLWAATSGAQPGTSAPAVSGAAAGVQGMQAPGREAPELLRNVLVAARTSPDSLTVGDTVNLEVLVEAPEKLQLDFPRLVTRSDEQVAFEDLKVEGPQQGKIAAAGRARWIGRYTLAVFGTGKLVLPPIPVQVRADSLYALARTDSIRFDVRSVLTDSLARADLRDLKPQAEIPVSRWPWIVAGAVLLAAVAALVWWLRRRRRPRAEIVPLVPQRAPHEVALEALRRLDARRLPLDGKFVAYYVQLTEILRRYLEDGFGIAALEETTEEIGRELERQGFEPSLVAQVRDLCAEADLVKFAKHEPTIEDCMRAIERTRDLVLLMSRRAARAAERVAAVAGAGMPGAVVLDARARVGTAAGAPRPIAASASPGAPARPAPATSGPDLEVHQPETLPRPAGLAVHQPAPIAPRTDAGRSGVGTASPARAGREGTGAAAAPLDEEGGSSPLDEEPGKGKR